MSLCILSHIADRQDHTFIVSHSISRPECKRFFFNFHRKKLNYYCMKKYMFDNDLVIYKMAAGKI